ncbi:MAG: hypothetical protein WC045_01550 [Patescibacteria group bacterium]
MEGKNKTQPKPHKKSGIENEKKWKIDHLPPKKYLNDPVQIVQGYLSRTPKEVVAYRSENDLNYAYLQVQDRAGTVWKKRIPLDLLIAFDDNKRAPFERRLRIAGDRCYFTIKSLFGGQHRTEWEKEIPSWVFDLLIGYTVGKQVKKLRYKVLHGRFTLEFDQYQQPEGKFSLECEFKSEREESLLVFPSWVTKLNPVEVTADSAWKNSNLAC